MARDTPVPELDSKMHRPYFSSLKTIPIWSDYELVMKRCIFAKVWLSLNNRISPVCAYFVNCCSVAYLIYVHTHLRSSTSCPATTYSTFYIRFLCFISLPSLTPLRFYSASHLISDLFGLDYLFALLRIQGLPNWITIPTKIDHQSSSYKQKMNTWCGMAFGIWLDAYLALEGALYRHSLPNDSKNHRDSAVSATCNLDPPSTDTKLHSHFPLNQNHTMPHYYSSAGSLHSHWRCTNTPQVISRRPPWGGRIGQSWPPWMWFPQALSGRDGPCFWYKNCW